MKAVLLQIESQEEWVEYVRNSHVKLDTDFFSYEVLKMKSVDCIYVGSQSLSFLSFLSDLREKINFSIRYFCVDGVEIDPSLDDLFSLSSEENREKRIFLKNIFPVVGFYPDRIYLAFGLPWYFVAFQDEKEKDGYQRLAFKTFEQAYSFFRGQLVLRKKEGVA